MLSSMRIAASSSSRLVISPSETPSLQDKGKGRATSPETPHDAVFCFSDEEDEQHMTATAGLLGHADKSPQQRLSVSNVLTDTPKSTDSASPLTPPFSLQSDSVSLQQSPWDRNEPRGVSIDLGDPFTFDPFTSQQHSYRAKASVLGMRRRPYQSGIVPISPPKEESRMSRMDRASIFSGLRSSAAHSPPPPADVPLIESMSSSSKRSFEQAISPLSSPSSTEGSSSSRHHENTSRAFTSSLSHSFDSLQRSHDITSSTSNLPSQVTRRRIPYKRRRAALLSPSILSESDSSAQLGESMLAVQEDSASSNSTEANNAFTVEGDRTGLERMSHSWSTLQNSFDQSGDSSVDNVDLPSSTTQLLRRWWVDTEGAASSGSQSGRSTVAEMGSASGTAGSQAGQDETRPISSSSTVFASSSLPGSHTVLRRLQLREREEEEDVQVRTTPSEAASGSDYHNQLIDVLRRMNDRSSQESARSAPRPPLRSTTMTRSTTQLSGDILSRNGSQAHSDTADDGSDVGDIITSYLEPDDANRQMGPPPLTLPPALSIGSDLTTAYSSHAPLSSRVSSLHAQRTTFRELARRNQEVLERYSNPQARVRPRHTGSPTFPTHESVEGSASRGWTPFESIDVDSETQDVGESTFHYRPPSSRRPAHGLSTLSSTAPRDIDADASLWGEYLLSRNSQRQSLQSTTIGDQNTSTPVNAREPSDAASQYLSGLSERLSSSTTAPVTARRRVGALDSSGRLRGPTRLQNENWLGMSSGEETDPFGFRTSLQQLQRMMQSTPSLEEQEQVMSTYRQMSFPDPESSIATPATEQETPALLNRPPRLPSLRSRSPFELPFVNATETSTPSSNVNQSLADHDGRSENLESFSSGRQTVRPHLRPLTLSSRTSSSLSHRNIRREPSTTGSTLLGSERRALPTFRFSDTSLTSEERAQRNASRLESPPHTPSELRELLEETGRADIMREHLDSLTSRRHRRRSQFDMEQRESSSQTDLESTTSSHLSRRLPVHSLSLRGSLRQRNSAGLHTRRRPTLLEADSSAVDMDLPSRDRFDLDSLMTPTREGQEESSSSSSRIAPHNLSSSRWHGARRPLNRWDRYMDEAGTSIGIRSIIEAQAQEQPFSTPPFSSALSRLPGGSLASTLHSEIATNPANYVADDEFALRDTYEGLQQLSAQIGDVRCKSTPFNVIAKLPTCLYKYWLGGSCKTTSLGRCSDIDLDACLSSPDKGKAKAREDTQSDKDTSCSICLESYIAIDTVMSLPCNHAFHQNCLTTWLEKARSCPCCRGDVCADEALINAKTTPLSSRILPELYF